MPIGQKTESSTNPIAIRTTPMHINSASSLLWDAFVL